MAFVIPLVLVAGMAYRPGSPLSVSRWLGSKSLQHSAYRGHLQSAGAGPEGELTGQLALGPQHEGSRMLGCATGSNLGWALGTRQCGYCLLSMSLVWGVRGVEAHCYAIVSLTLMTTCPDPPSGVHCKSPKGRRCTSFPCVTHGTDKVEGCPHMCVEGTGGTGCPAVMR